MASTCYNYSNLAALQAAGSCNIGDVTFSNFTYSNHVAPADVVVTASGTGLAGGFAGFSFQTNSGWQGSPFTLHYQVDCFSCVIVGAHFNANIQPIIGGGGMQLKYDASPCGNGTATTADQDHGFACNNGKLNVQNILQFGSGQDRLMALQNDYYVGGAAPEPSSGLLLGGLLLGLGLVKWRKKG